MYRFPCVLRRCSLHTRSSSRGLLRASGLLLQQGLAGGAYGNNSSSKSKTETSDQAVALTRNIGIVAHIDAGKTTTTERMLYYAGVVRRVGDVDSGTTTTDFMKEEMDRGITIQSAAVSLQWKDYAIHLIDTPGHVDFTVEVERAMRVVDGVVALFDASAGVQAQSYTVLQQSRKFNVPVLAFLNKMDKYNADYDMSVKSIRSKLQVEPLLLQVPLRSEDGSFEGVVDVVEQKAIRFSGEHGAKMTVQDLGNAGEGCAYVMESVKAARHALITQLTGFDDVLSEKFIELLDATDGDEVAAENKLSAEALRAAVRRIVLCPKQNHLPVMPVLCGASRRDQGVQPLLDAVTYYLPSPLERHLHGYTRDGQLTPLPPVSSNPSVPTVALAFKVTFSMSPKGTRQPLVFIRVYSGRVVPRMRLHNNSRGKSETIDKLYVMHADKPVEVPFLSAGDIGAAFLTHTYTGDTLFAAPAHHVLHDKEHIKTGEETAQVHTLEGIESPPPVISFSIEAATKHQVALLEEALSELSREDPSLRVSHNDFGNVVVSGMGELHLEIIMSRLEHEHQVRCSLLRAIIEYRETVLEPQRLERETAMLNEVPYAECSLDLRPLVNDQQCGSSAQCVFRIDPTFAADYVNSQRSSSRGGGDGKSKSGSRNAQEDLAMMQACFSAALADCSRMGPLAGMPMHGVEVVLTYFRKAGGSVLQDKTLNPVARSLILQLLKAVPCKELAIVEPMMEVEVHLSEPTYIGNVVSSLNSHKALTVDVQEDGKSVKAVVAMRNIVRYTMELRKAVKGHANLYTKLDHYRVIEDKAVIARILKNMGIAE